ncbi:MAG: FkbM family methyltransferase [Burkholderiaceae bacterium]
MAIELLKRLFCRLPLRQQQALKCRVYRRQMSSGRFVAPEWEFKQLERWLKPGDWVVDVGANIGHYTKRFSELVGPAGRVFAVEPVPDTFEILASNAAMFADQNVTLLNVAASTINDLVHIEIPRNDNGLQNYFLASVSDNKAGIPVVAMPVDALGIKQRVKLVKIDVEGHEIHALRGMRQLLERDHPVLIVEGQCQQVNFFLTELGYRFEQQPGSVNRVFLPLAQAWVMPSFPASGASGDTSFEDGFREQGTHGYVRQVNRVANAQVRGH